MRGYCAGSIQYPGRALPPLEHLICPECIASLSPVRQPVCMRCGKEVTGSRIEYCPDCMRHPRSFDGGAALFHYNEAARRSMAAIKYKNRREYLDFYSQALFPAMENGCLIFSLMPWVPVPVHPARRRKRGLIRRRSWQNESAYLPESRSGRIFLSASEKHFPKKN